MTTRRTPVAADGAPRGNPLVGIWWDGGTTLAALAHPTTENASTAAGFIDSDLEHWREWKHIAALFGKSASEEYFSVPRGRVLLHQRTGRGVIYHGSSTSPDRLAVIAAEFQMTDWKAAIDPHYQMRDAADELFDDDW